MKEVTDPDGQRVVLDEEAWNHISARHPELMDRLDVILGTVARPDHRTLDPIASRRRYWRRLAAPSRWLLVIVDVGDSPARVVTAFGHRRDPEELTP